MIIKNPQRAPPIGGNKSINWVLGNIVANAVVIPKTAPDAPKMGDGDNNICSAEAARPDVRYKIRNLLGPRVASTMDPNIYRPSILKNKCEILACENI